MLTTVVIGAGPAGLLFCILGRLLHRKSGREPSEWTLRLFDKRDVYARTHRLRMDPRPYLAIQQELAEPAFDRVIGFLRENDFAPEVNLLEAYLEETLAQLGVAKERLEIGRVSLAELRSTITGPLTIVAADSVHSTVRELVRGDVRALVQTHERVARLRVTGAALPSRLAVLEQVRLSKVLGSLLDYRLNRNGFAEVDLFLTEREHDAVGGLGATPAHPVPLTGAALSVVRAPLFRAVVDHLERGLAGRCTVFLQSTFRLEHMVMPRVSFTPSAIDAQVFLLGDAALSLPFFRGMACLARCAHALARAHVEGRFGSYEAEVARIRDQELAIVRARARLIRGARETMRVSALLPFPIQSWLLNAPELDRPRDCTSTGFWLNAAVATVALVLTLAGRGWSAVPIELLGGVAFHWTVSVERGPHRWVRRVWQMQIAALFVAGVAMTARASLAAGSLAEPMHATWWLVLAVPFVLGLYLFERFVTHTFERAELEERS